MGFHDITDDILLTPMLEYDDVMDINYDKTESDKFTDDNGNSDSSRVYRIKFSSEDIIDKILPTEIGRIENNKQNIPVSVHTVSTGKGVENVMYIRIS
jgi:CBS-domain-containing membrane protein